MEESGLYKYVYNDEIIYIGMSCTSVGDRIRAHASDDKFRPYLRDSKIYWIKMDNHTEIRHAEGLLINKYKPILNGTDTQNEGFTIDIEDKLGSWVQYNPYQDKPGLLPKDIRKLKSGLKKAISIQNELEHNIEFLVIADKLIRMYETNLIIDNLVKIGVLYDNGICLEDLQKYNFYLNHGGVGLFCSSWPQSEDNNALIELSPLEKIVELRGGCLDFIRQEQRTLNNLSDDLLSLVNSIHVEN